MTEIFILEGKDAERFIKQDKKPLSNEQKKYLKKCQEIYESNLPKSVKK